MEKCYALKGQSLENGLFYISGYGNYFKAAEQHDSAQAAKHKG